MDNDTKSLLISIVGSIIGAAIIYYIIIKPTIRLQQSNQLQLQNRIQLLELQLQPYQQTQPYQPLTIQSPLSSSYKNAEKWEITRNKEGFISNIRVSRDARVTN